MCRLNPSESGHGGGFVPCEEYKRLEQKYDALREAADKLAEVVEGIKPTVLYKRRPQDYVHMTDCEKMNALAMAFKAYKEARDAR